MNYKIYYQKYIHDHFFKIMEAEVQYDHFDESQSRRVTRYGIDKGPAVACIIYVRDIDKYVLVRQFRYPVCLIPDENPWIYEIVAGTIDGDESPQETARKEIQEEAGYIVDELELIQELYLSPGISSELIYLFFCNNDECQFDKNR